jgi:hypothetical protein
VAVADPTTRTINVTIATKEGEIVDDPSKAALATLYDEFRLSTWLVYLHDATYTTISVDYEVHPLPGVDGVDLLARIDAMLADALSPARSGRPAFGDTRSTAWVVDPRVREHRLIRLIGDVLGSDFVGTVTITGSAGAASGNDWVLPGGGVPVTRAGTMSGTLI